MQTNVGTSDVPVGIDSYREKMEESTNTEFRGNQHTVNEVDKYSEEKIVEGVERLADEVDGTPSIRDLDGCDYLPSYGAFYKFFDSWNELLEELDLEINQVSEYSDSDVDDMIEDIKRCYAEVDGNLTTRVYIEIGDYSHSTIKKHFGSWTDALKEAGVESGEKHGQSVECKCGAMLDSVNEKIVGDMLHKLGVEHIPHKQLPGSRYLTDFYLPNPNLWIEVDGYKKAERPNRDAYSDKKSYYKECGLDFLEIKVPYTLNESKVKDIIAEEIN